MEYNQTFEVIDDKKPCMTWFEHGHCPRADGCNLDHHDNLHPTKHQKVHSELVVENETGRSCDRCLAKMLKCDKVGRGAGGDDPCSECRHFNGNTGARACVLSETNTVNDALCRMMLNAPKTAYALPEQTHRLIPSKSKTTKNGQPGAAKPAPVPMATHDIKADWRGKTKEELVDMPSWIPQDMREHPRAYLVPARESRNNTKSKAYLEQHPEARDFNSDSIFKRSIETASTSQGSHLFLAPPPFSRPAADPERGECVESEWDWRKSIWVMKYEDGTTVSVASHAGPNK